MKCFSSDDICSNHWVMSLTDIKSPTWRCRKKRRRGADSLDWWCHGEKDVWHFLLLPLFRNPVGHGRSGAAACSLWLWDNLWELRKCKNLIYSCRWRRSWGGTRQSVKSSGLWWVQSIFFDCVFRLPSTEQPDLVKVFWIVFVTACTLSVCLWLNGQGELSTHFSLASHQCEHSSIFFSGPLCRKCVWFISATAMCQHPSVTHYTFISKCSVCSPSLFLPKLTVVSKGQKHRATGICVCACCKCE